MPKYYLGQPFISGKQIEINDTEFESLRKARDSIVGCLTFENLYYVLFGSFREFEAHVLEATFNDFFSSLDSSETHFELQIYFDRIRAESNVKILALLSAARAYHDQRNRALASVSSLDPRSIDQPFRNEYDASLNYRVFEALRNFAQHASLPIQSISFSGENLWPSGRPQEGVPSVYRATVRPLISVSELLSDKAFKGTVSKALQAKEHLKLDARALARSYLASIAKRHMEVTDLLSAEKDKAKASIRYFTDEFVAKFPDADLEHLSVWGDELDGKLWIGGTLIEKLERYQGAKRGHIALRRGFVSSEITSAKSVMLSEFEDVWTR